jgi:hypothetical protein
METGTWLDARREARSEVLAGIAVDEATGVDPIEA